MLNPTRTVKPAIAKEHEYRSHSAAIITELKLAEQTAITAHKRQLHALIGRLQLCNHAENLYRVIGAYRETNGTTSDSVGRFWRCNSKLCPSCLARQSRINRNKLRAAIDQQQPKKKQTYKFITMTIPNPDLSLVMTRSIVQYAWSLFRKRSLFRALVEGGAKSEEFTLTPNGYHYHLHILALTDWILYAEFRRTWTDCVETSFIEHDHKDKWQESQAERERLNAEWNAKHPNEEPKEDTDLIVVIKECQPTESAIHEVCKYVTKSDSWSKIDRKDLIEIAMIRRWSRMFELFGSFKPSADPRSGTAVAIVHTRSLSDGNAVASRTYWRDIVETMHPETYLIALEDAISRQREYAIRDLRARFPDCEIETFTE